MSEFSSEVPEPHYVIIVHDCQDYLYEIYISQFLYLYYSHQKVLALVKRKNDTNLFNGFTTSDGVIASQQVRSPVKSE